MVVLCGGVVGGSVLDGCVVDSGVLVNVVDSGVMAYVVYLEPFGLMVGVTCSGFMVETWYFLLLI